MLFKKLQLIFILTLFGSDSASSDATKAMAADGTLADYDPDVPSMVVEDNGVVSW